MLFNILKREVAPLPRPVVRSRQLLARQLTVEEVQALDRLEAESNQGLNLNGYLSKKLVDASYNDMLLNDWGVHHFHLGARGADQTGFAGRTKNLLFARVEPNCIFFIDVLDHSSFAETDLVEIMHGNWPELLKRYRIDGLRLHTTFTSAQLTALRKAGANPFFQTADGTLYSSPGGGYMTNGVSQDVVTTLDTALRQTRELETHVRQHADDLALLFGSGTQLPELNLEFDPLHSPPVVCETTTGVKVPVRFG